MLIYIDTYIYIYIYIYIDIDICVYMFMEDIMVTTIIYNIIII